MIVVARGPLAVEKVLLQRVDELLENLDADTQLRCPLRIIVPSQSLRQHVAAALLRHRGRGLAGVVVQTLFAAAIEVLDRAGASLPVDDTLFTVIVQQLAARDPALRAALGDLADGYASVSATVADLLDAGFIETHAEAANELLAAAEGDAAARARTQAVVRVAAQSLAALAHWRVTRTSTLLQHARDRFIADPLRLLPARAVLVHGFADATGVATDFIEELVRSHAATLYLDHPPDPSSDSRADPSSDSRADPVDGSRADAGIAFTERLRSRFAGAVHEDEPAAASREVAPTRLTLLRAPGSDAEVRAVAKRVRLLLDNGVPSESIGIVVRDLTPYTTALRTHLTRLGIAFSGLGARAAIDGRGRRVRAALALLQHGHRAPIERWLDAATRLRDSDLTVMQRADLRIALRAHGGARVGDAAALDAEGALAGRAKLPLPVRRGLRADEDNPDSEPIAERRKLDGSVWRQAIAAAGHLLHVWQQWPQQAGLREHVAHASRCLVDELGWQPTQEPLISLARLLQTLPLDFPLQRDEFLALLERVTADVGSTALGGAGAGVQVLSVVEARARTWPHLFLLGVNRDVFPRIVREDPILPDRLRRGLTTLLPDLPIKEVGFDEERYLFAQLLAASRDVTLSWQFIDDDGKPRIASTLIERLTAARPDLQVETMPSLYAAPVLADGEERRPGEVSARRTAQLAFGFTQPEPTPETRHPKPETRDPTPDTLRPAHEHAVLAGLYADRTVFAQVLPLAMAEIEIPDVESATLSQARLAVLNEIDPSQHSAAGRAARQQLGPYFGFVGGVRARADLRRQRLFVTTIERLARCPWQTFLLRLLGLEESPDPIASLPAITPLMVGSTVHQVLEDIVRGSLGERERGLEALLQQAAVTVAWPAPAELESRLRAAAMHVLREEGIGLAGFAHVLVERARPYLQAAQSFEWGDSPPSVLAVEAEGRVRLGGERELWFRADRVDRTAQGLRLTDYKTGKPFPDVKTEAVRRQKLVAKVRAAEALQAPAYALAARDLTGAGAGRYAFLKPDIDDYAREAVVLAADAEMEEAFALAVATVLDAWDTGSFFPRLVDADKDTEPISCTYCAVAAACLRGDSGARRRLREWGEGQGGLALTDAERALLAVWRLGAKEARKADDE